MLVGLLPTVLAKVCLGVRLLLAAAMKLSLRNGHGLQNGVETEIFIFPVALKFSDNFLPHLLSGCNRNSAKKS